LQTSSGFLTSACPGLHWKASANSGMFRDDAVDAITRRRVRVDDRVDAHLLRALVLARPLREADEEALRGRQPSTAEALRLRLFLPCHPREQLAARSAMSSPEVSATVDLDVVD
jgi:hypothetical protein